MYAVINGRDYTAYTDTNAISHRTTVTDPMAQAVITVGDPGSTFSFSALQQIVLIDETGVATNPTHNFLLNPSLISTSSANYFSTNSGVGPILAFPGTGVTFTYSNNGSGTFTAANQTIQPGLVVAGQSYILSVYVQATSPVGMTNAAFLSIVWLDAAGNTLGTATSQTTPTTSQVRVSLQSTAPANTYSATLSFGGQSFTNTNSGVISYTTAQFEPVWFTSQGISYPTPDCNASQTNCVVLPNGTTVRQTRLFAGYITKIDVTYDGVTRYWTLTCASNSLLLETFFVVNQQFENQRSDQIINTIVTTNYTIAYRFQTASALTYQLLALPANPPQGQVVDYLTLPDLTFREVLNTLSNLDGFYFYVDNYFTLIYAPPGNAQAAFGLSDNPNPSPTDGSLPTYIYTGYKLTIDFTQPKNRVKVLGGKFVGGSFAETLPAGDGVTKKFFLSYSPNIMNTITVNGTSQTRIGVVGQDKLGGTFPVTYSKSGKYITFNTAPANAATIIATYQYDEVATVRARDMGAIAQYNNMIFDTRISDTGLISTADANSRAIAELQQFSTPRTLVKCTVQQQLIAGYTVQFTSSLDGLSKVPLLVQDSTMVPKGAGIFEWQCNLGAYNPNILAMLYNIHKAMNRSTNAANLPILQETLVVFDNINYAERSFINPYVAAVVADAPLGYYRMGEASGTTAKDRSATASLNGTYSGGFTLSQTGAIASDPDTAVLLNGTNGIVALPAGATSGGATAWSVECWFKLSNTAFGSNPRIVADSFSQSDNKGFELLIPTGATSVQATMGNGAAHTTASKSITLVAGVYYHVVATWDGAQVKVYVNAAVGTGVSFLGTISAPAQNPAIGYNPAYSGDYFPGTVDEVALYPTGLSAARVLAHYNKGLGM